MSVIAGPTTGYERLEFLRIVCVTIKLHRWLEITSKCYLHSETLQMILDCGIDEGNPDFVLELKGYHASITHRLRCNAFLS